MKNRRLTVDLQINESRSDQRRLAVHFDVRLGLLIEKQLLGVHNLAIANPEVILCHDLSIANQSAVCELDEFNFSHRLEFPLQAGHVEGHWSSN